MRGVSLKILREAWLATLLFAVALLLIEVLLNLVLPQVLGQMGDMLDRLPFIRKFLGALLGVEVEGDITAQLMAAFVWVHPVVLALIWASEIIFCTRYPAGEIDRGTIDVLLGLPVSRRQVYLCESAGWLLSGLIILAFAAIGNAIGSQAMALEYRPSFGLVVLVLLNLYGVYVAVGGLTFLVSSLSDRRGRAVTVIFGLVLASFLLNFLAQFWDPAKHIVFLSVLDYYQPALILREGAIAPSDLFTLLGVGAITWAIGMEVTARRSIATT